MTGPNRIVGTAFLAVMLVAGLLVPFVFEDSYIRHLFIIGFIYAMVAASWDLSLGYAGLFNFGHVAFFGIGVYATALLAKLAGVDPWLAMLAGGFAASAGAVIVSLPIARLTGIYVVMATFAFGQLVLQLVISQSEVTGGTQGLISVPTISIFGHNFLRDFKFGYYYVAFALLLVTVICLRLIVRSDFGLSVRALRDNEEYSAARGIAVGGQRLKVLVVSAFFAGIAGGFYAIYLRVASPEIFGFSMMSLVLSMVLVGGTATIYGPVAAALALTFVYEGLAGFQSLQEGRFLIVAVAMILVLLFLPGGLGSVMSSNRKKLGS